MAPVAADYPAYGSDAFAALAGTTLNALTQPDPVDEEEEQQQGWEDGNDDDDDDDDDDDNRDSRGLDGESSQVKIYSPGYIEHA